MIKGDFIGQVYELDKEATLIGRADELELVVSDTSISRKHAMIVKREDGFYFSDLGSTNGCWINREKVSDHTRLHEGDKITLGADTVVFKFSYQDEDDAKYHQMLRNMAVKDGLTRIYNKRYFDEALNKEFEFSKRNAVGLALIIFDIDHFKKVNDSWGHPAGDVVLRKLAQLISNEVRGYDVFARYGGEEFAFLLRGGRMETASTLAERVRELIEQQDFHYDEVDLNITVSLGVAWWDGGDAIDDANRLLEAADKLLYEAKDAGKNCVRQQSF